MTNNAFVSPKVFKKTALEEPDKLKGLRLRKHFVDTEIKQQGDEAERLLKFTISTGSVDRMLDTISPKGWSLKHYKKNPVVLFAHDSNQPPIGIAPNIGIEDDALKATAKFVERDINPFADMIYRMCQEGYLRATSVGFDPIDWEWADPEDEKRNRGGWQGMDFKKQELLEFSVVPVPANPECLIEARTKGIDTHPLQEWFEEALDQWADYKGLLLIPRKQVETFYEACREGTRSKSKTLHLSETEQADLLKKNLESIKEASTEEIEEVLDPVETLLDVKDTVSDEVVVEEEAKAEESEIEAVEEPVVAKGNDEAKPEDDEDDEDEDDDENEKEKSVETVNIKLKVDDSELDAAVAKAESIAATKVDNFNFSLGEKTARAEGMKLLGMAQQKAGGFIFTFGFGELDSTNDKSTGENITKSVKDADDVIDDVTVIDSQEEEVVLLLEDGEEQTGPEVDEDSEDVIQIDEDTAKVIGELVAKAVDDKIRQYTGQLPVGDD